jgi:UDP-N-acetylmuramate dehydrogenase
VFKHAQGQRAGASAWDRAVITRCAFLPKPWKPVLGYPTWSARCGDRHQRARRAQIFDWVCAIRRAKLPDPAVLGNAGSFFKNPTVTPEQCADIIQREPRIVHYPWTTAASSWPRAG